MRIAQVSPLFESVPPQLYGGTERVVSYLTEELVRLGHDVTLFASGDSRSSARLAPCSERALRLAGIADPHAYHTLQLERVFARQDEFDIVHFHTDYYHFPLSRRMRTPYITTLHGRLDFADLVPLYEEFRDTPLVSISDSQREPLAFSNWAATVYHGLPPEQFPFRERPDQTPYLAVVGRVSPEKRVDDAIRIARTLGIELRIAAKVDKADEHYFNQVIRPMLREPGIVFLGEQDEQAKCRLIAGALAFLFPIDWPEPFGLVMVESMACGTPVVARRRGSIPEVVDDGITGVIFDDPRHAPRAVERAASLSRERCRHWFEARFSARRMAEDYLRVYRRLVGQVRSGIGSGASTVGRAGAGRRTEANGPDRRSVVHDPRSPSSDSRLPIPDSRPH